MKTKTKIVYYCEYCGKHLLRKDSILNHELHCTMNPGRHCGLCGNSDLFPIVAKYLVRYILVDKNGLRELKWIDPFGHDDERVKLENIIEDVDYCPVCTLAVLRICELNIWETHIEFNYKKALED